MAFALEAGAHTLHTPRSHAPAQVSHMRIVSMVVAARPLVSLHTQYLPELGRLASARAEFGFGLVASESHLPRVARGLRWGDHGMATECVQQTS